MGNGSVESKLIIIEQEKIKVYHLDNKLSWEIGRPSRAGKPDIEFVTPTISRPHGILKNKSGLWLYSDYCKLNGTTYNGEPITMANNHIILEDGDVLVFGGHGKDIVSPQTVWGLYLKRDLSDTYCTVDTSKDETLKFTDGNKVTKFVRPEKGTVVDKGTGLGIYMGRVTYLFGDIWLK